MQNLKELQFQFMFTGINATSVKFTYSIDKDGVIEFPWLHIHSLEGPKFCWDKKIVYGDKGGYHLYEPINGKDRIVTDAYGSELIEVIMEKVRVQELAPPTPPIDNYYD